MEYIFHAIYIVAKYSFLYIWNLINEYSKLFYLYNRVTWFVTDFYFLIIVEFDELLQGRIFNS